MLLKYVEGTSKEKSLGAAGVTDSRERAEPVLSSQGPGSWAM